MTLHTVILSINIIKWMCAALIQFVKCFSIDQRKRIKSKFTVVKFFVTVKHEKSKGFLRVG